MKQTQTRLIGRRRFLAGLSTFVMGSLFFGYKALSKDTVSNDSESLSAQVAAANIKPKPIPKPNARMGINFSGIAYWASELPFANLMYQSGEWVSQPPSGDWGTGPILTLDKDGWVKKLEKGCYVTKILCSGDDVAYPSGTYVVLYEGEGEIELLAPIGIVRKVGQGRLEIDVDSKRGMFAINIIATNPENHMRNIRVIAPGLESSYQHSPWHPAFIKRWAGVACIRVMDMMATNHSTQKDWQNRPKPDDVSYAEKGVPVELLVDLANTLDTDVWFCMPHLANDDYIEQFAMVVKNNLKPYLHAWVEYSNEVWNGGFDQYDYAAQQGKKLRLSNNEWEGAFLYNAKRSVDIFKVWETVFGSNNRLVKVIASQAPNEWLSFQLLKAPEMLAHVDVLAIAPYIAMNVFVNADGGGLAADKVVNWNLDQVFEYIHTVALPDANKWIDANKQVADAYGVKLVAYEAGQHLVGVAGAEKNDKLTKLLTQANQDVRMAEIYTKHLLHWQKAGGDLMCLFNSTQGWSPYGSWGLLQQYNDHVEDSPKFKAVMDWAKSRGQKVSY
jgi:hypothetical protein